MPRTLSWSCRTSKHEQRMCFCTLFLSFQDVAGFESQSGDDSLQQPCHYDILWHLCHLCSLFSRGPDFLTPAASQELVDPMASQVFWSPQHSKGQKQNRSFQFVVLWVSSSWHRIWISQCFPRKVTWRLLSEPPSRRTLQESLAQDSRPNTWTWDCWRSQQPSLWPLRRPVVCRATTCTDGFATNHWDGLATNHRNCRRWKASQLCAWVLPGVCVRLGCLPLSMRRPPRSLGDLPWPSRWVWRRTSRPCPTSRTWFCHAACSARGTRHEMIPGSRQEHRPRDGPWRRWGENGEIDQNHFWSFKIHSLLQRLLQTGFKWDGL